MDENTVNITAILPTLHNDESIYIYRLSKTVRFLSIIDFFFGFFMLFYGQVGFYIIYRLLCSLCGYYGSKQYDFSLSSIYLVFLFFGAVLELLLIYIYKKLYNQHKIDYNTLYFGVIYQLILFFFKSLYN